MNNDCEKEVQRTLNYPLQITEHPYQGEPRTWVLLSKEHLKSCIIYAQRSGYSDWQRDQGNMVFIEHEEGLIAEYTNTSELDAYLDWLRHNLSTLDVGEISDKEAYDFMGDI